MLFFDIAHAAWRSVLLLAIGVAPYAAPLDALPTTSAGIASVRLLVFVVIATLFALVIRVGGRRNKALSLLAAATLAAAIVLPPVFTGANAPLARGALWIAPLVWGTLAALAANLPLAILARAAARAAVVVVFVAGGVASALASRHNLEDARLTRAALLLDPGNEPFAVALASQKRAAGDARGAFDVVARCAAARPGACRCLDDAASAGVDLALHKEVLALFEPEGACERTAARAGIHAEALVGSGDHVAGAREAEAALALDANEPHAAYAAAWSLFLGGDAKAAKDAATKPAARARGVQDNLLLGLILFREGDVAGAKEQYEAALGRSPTDARATYSLATLAQQRGSYRDAREGYLRTLKLDPTYADARHNLAVLTFEKGVFGEARHHVEAFAESFPEDSRVDALRRMVGGAKE